jgi:hypothetical protein
MKGIPVVISSVGPDFGAVGGSSDIRQIVGALLTYGLLIAVLMLLVCAAGWAIGSANASWQTASKAKAGLLVALLGAVLIGGALAWANWLLGVGASL